jgi:16S rRNA (guanine527-N7)-methyltransferase
MSIGKCKNMFHMEQLGLKVLTVQDISELMDQENVPRGTNLEIYLNTLVKWQGSINLIASSTVDKVWQRHFIDSLQLIPLIPAGTRSCIDLGSGAGFPGLVINIVSALEMTLIESDRKKCMFLRQVIRLCSAHNVSCLNARIEQVDNLQAPLIISRALAPLDSLFCYSQKLLINDGVMLFLKGENLNNEIAEAEKKWHFNYEILKSNTSLTGKIIKVWDLYDKGVCNR